MKQVKRVKSAAERTSSPQAKAALLRSGGGKHGDRRLKRQRTRATQKAAALRD